MPNLSLRRLPWRGIVSALLLAPAISMLTAAAVVWGDSHTLAASLPLGIHTLVPAALLVPMPVLEVGALLALLLGTLVLAGAPGRRQRHHFSALWAVVLLVAAQALLFGIQLLIVDQAHGIPDAAVAIAAAAALPAIGLSLTAGGAVAVGLAFAAVPSALPGLTRLGPATAAPYAAPVLAPSGVRRSVASRGPPATLLSN